jgi:hypothetical protein
MKDPSKRYKGKISPFKDKNGTVLKHGDKIETSHIPNKVRNSQPEIYKKVGVLEYFEGYRYGWRIRWAKGYMMIPNTIWLQISGVKIGSYKCL